MCDLTACMKGAALIAVAAVTTVETAYGFRNNADGARPQGGVAVSGTTIFGTASQGGECDGGTIWSLDTSTDTFTKLHDFSGAPNGLSPIGGVSVSGTMLFGMARNLSANDRGTIWSFDTSTNTYTNLHVLSEASDGNWTIGNFSVSDQKIFATAVGGGANDSGTIWSFDTSDGTFTNLHNFTQLTDGGAPSGLTRSGDTVFGTAIIGGANGDGTIWSFDISDGTFTNLHNFSGFPIDGRDPRGGLAVSGTTLLGTTGWGGIGGAPGDGTIWSFDTSDGTFTNLHNFREATDGRSPEGVVLTGMTTVVGTTGLGRTNGGTLWSFDTDTHTFTTVHDFGHSADGGNLSGGLAVSGTMVYGTAQDYGAHGSGTIWSFDTSTNTFTNLYDFSRRDESVIPPRCSEVDYRFKTIEIPGAFDVRPLDINNHGLIVGTYRKDPNPGSNTFGFVWDSETFSTLDTPVDSIGVNDAGVIVTGGPCPDQPSANCAFLIEAGSYVPIESPVSGTSNIVASGINNENTIVGSYRVEDTVFVFRKSGDDFVSFEYPFPAESVFGIGAHDVNDSGEIVATAQIRFSADFVVKGFVLSDEEATELGYPNHSPRTINNRGDIAGSYSVCTNGCEGHGFILADGTRTTIDFPGSLSTAIHGMNDHGDLVGDYYLPGGYRHGFIATFIPEPSGQSLALVCVVILFGLRGRRS